MAERSNAASHPAFQTDQRNPLHDPAWGELERGSLVPVDDGRDDLTAWKLRGQAVREKEQAARAIAEARIFLQGMEAYGSLDDENDRRMDISFLPDGEPRSASEAIATAMTQEFFARTEDMFHVRDLAKSYQDYAKSSAESLDLTTASKERALKGTQQLTDSDAELADAGAQVNAVISTTTSETEAMSAAFAVASGERLPELIGQMGTLEDRTLAAVNAFSQLAAAPGAPTRAGGVSSGGRSARTRQAEVQAFLDTPPPSNLAEIFLDQFKQGHDMSGFRDADHWWEAHLKHVAQLKAAGHAFAQGTSFAPGGMALVGEMGPELVNLPRGSQVIPNPRLGSEVTVNVTVEGSVVAERDLAQRIRQELIRTSRRTVDLGFVA
ncbi:MAG: hypothetical protein OXO54_11830 [Chloroflexota bacterium]|nr:hypothetical protein [Chloroflexota bacterium]MDE2899002.1 hypothetical protein [Chloroflexota bacterium]